MSAEAEGGPLVSGPLARSPSGKSDKGGLTSSREMGLSRIVLYRDI
jgi:hypothetical protein